MKILLLVLILFCSVNIYSQKVTHKDLIGHWLRIFPAEDTSVVYSAHYIDFIDSVHYNLVDTLVATQSLVKSTYGTLFANYELDTLAKYSRAETWTGTNPGSRAYHTDFYLLRKKNDLLFMKYIKNKDAEWNNNDSAYLKIYQRATPSNPQEIQTISFVYGVKELKPHGSLTISIDSSEFMPKNKPLDSVFGKGIVTEIQTFYFIREFLKKSRYTNSTPDSLGSNKICYKIICSSGLATYLPEKYFSNFFNELSDIMMEKQLDKQVIDALKYYYSNWRNPK